MESMGLYDSATQESCEPLKTVDVTAEQTKAKEAVFVYTKVKRGRIVQLRSDGMRLHYFRRRYTSHTQPLGVW
jgi:hypothetical protein